MLLHTEAFTPQRQTHLHTEKNTILPQFLPIEPHFVRKGCAGHFKIAMLPQFLAIEPHFVRKGCAGHFKIAMLPQFLAIEPHLRGQEGKRARGEDVR